MERRVKIIEHTLRQGELFRNILERERERGGKEMS